MGMISITWSALAGLRTGSPSAFAAWPAPWPSAGQSTRPTPGRRAVRAPRLPRRSRREPGPLCPRWAHQLARTVPALSSGHFARCLDSPDRSLGGLRRHCEIYLGSGGPGARGQLGAGTGDPCRRGGGRAAERHDRRAVDALERPARAEGRGATQRLHRRALRDGSWGEDHRSSCKASGALRSASQRRSAARPA